MKFPSVGQLGSEFSPEMQQWKEKIFSAEMKISSQSTPLKNSAEQDSSSTVLLSSSVKFFSAIWQI